jgi:hypothetical protein
MSGTSGLSVRFDASLAALMDWTERQKDSWIFFLTFCFDGLNRAAEGFLFDYFREWK